MRWYLTKDKPTGPFVIRGGKKNERYPLKKYIRIRDDEAALEQLVKRLNAPADAKLKVSYKHAFINQSLLDEYLRYLIAQIPRIEGARQEYSYLRRHFLDYFIGKLDLMNPLDWHRVHETQWAEFLLSKEVPAAAKTKRDIVIAANRFMGWLHKQRPEEVPPLEFKPISKAKYKEIEAQRALGDGVKERGAIPPAHLARILRHLPEEISGHVRLALHYGLRRNETMGLQLADVKKGYLAISRQYSGRNDYRPLKGKDKRNVPHWAGHARHVYHWIESVSRYPMHPSSLSDAWASHLKTFGFSYDFHDLRHTFITKMLRHHPARDVQLAAGHKDIRTTMRYAHDDRKLDDEIFDPNA